MANMSTSKAIKFSIPVQSMIIVLAVMALVYGGGSGWAHLFYVCNAGFTGLVATMTLVVLAARKHVKRATTPIHPITSRLKAYLGNQQYHSYFHACL